MIWTCGGVGLHRTSLWRVKHSAALSQKATHTCIYCARHTTPHTAKHRLIPRSLARCATACQLRATRRARVCTQQDTVYRYCFALVVSNQLHLLKYAILHATDAHTPHSGSGKTTRRLSARLSAFNLRSARLLITKRCYPRLLRTRERCGNTGAGTPVRERRLVQSGTTLGAPGGCTPLPRERGGLGN